MDLCILSISRPEKAMYNATLMMVGIALAWPQEMDATTRAIAIVKKAGGTLVFDEKIPSKPVIGLNL